MLLKLIRCDVAAERREAFATGQQAWSAVAERPGFLGQAGGWTERQACLASWWTDWAAYSGFRKELHDHLLARSGHGLACDRIEVSYWEAVPEEQVDRRGSSDVREAPGLLQVELLELAPGCLPEFREFLTWRWHSALAGSTGLHEARLCRHRKRPGRYLIWSLWAAGARPTSFAGLLQPGYRIPQRRLQLLRSHEAMRMPLETTWSVPQAEAGETSFLVPEES